MDETARGSLARVSGGSRKARRWKPAFVSENTVSNFFRRGRAATERLSAAISETVEGIARRPTSSREQTRRPVRVREREDLHARPARSTDHACQSRHRGAKPTRFALNATIQATRGGERGGSFTNVVGDIKTLAGRIGEANEDIARRLCAIRGATSDTVGSVRSIVQKLDMVLQQTRTIRARDGAAGRGDARKSPTA